MAAEKTATNVTPVDEAGWETVVSESGAPIDFSEVGASFVGIYTGEETITPVGWDEKDYFIQHHFKDAEGNTRVVNGGFKLNEGLKEIAVGSTVRITRTADVPMNDAGKNPMKDFRIEVKR